MVANGNRSMADLFFSDVIMDVTSWEVNDVWCYIRALLQLLLVLRVFEDDGKGTLKVFWVAF